MPSGCRHAPFTEHESIPSSVAPVTPVRVAKATTHTMRMHEWLELKKTLRNSADVVAYSAKYHQHSYETVFAVFQQLYTRQMARTFYLVKLHGQKFVSRYKAGHSLLDIAEWINLAPTMVARRVMELHCGMSRKAISAAMRDPMKIEDTRLRKQVEQCVQCDEYSGPAVDRARNVIGQEYELRLADQLRALRLQFECENDLRARGCYKTPDVLLRVPVAFCGSVVCWVDSKAKFGDEFTLTKDYNDSISSYVGRFGPGMVVYWFGFIDDSISPMLADTGLLVVDSFPSQVHMLPGSCLSPPPSQQLQYTFVDDNEEERADD